MPVVISNKTPTSNSKDRSFPRHVTYIYILGATLVSLASLVSCTIKALVSCTSSVRCHSGSRLGGRFPVSVTAHVLCISGCLVPAHVQI